MIDQDDKPVVIIERDHHDWRKKASCRSLSPTLFILERGQDHRQALKVCRDCVVKNPCLRYALDNNEIGIWGGTTGKERRRMKKLESTMLAQQGEQHGKME